MLLYKLAARPGFAPKTTTFASSVPMDSHTNSSPASTLLTKAPSSPFHRASAAKTQTPSSRSSTSQCPTPSNPQPSFLPRKNDRRPNPEVGIDQNRAYHTRRLCAQGRVSAPLDRIDNRHKPLPLLVARENLDIVSRFQALGPQEDLYQQETGPLVRVLGVLRMHDVCPG